MVDPIPIFRRHVERVRRHGRLTVALIERVRIALRRQASASSSRPRRHLAQPPSVAPALEPCPSVQDPPPIPGSATGMAGPGLILRSLSCYDLSAIRHDLCLSA